MLITLKRSLSLEIQFTRVTQDDISLITKFVFGFQKHDHYEYIINFINTCR